MDKQSIVSWKKGSRVVLNKEKKKGQVERQTHTIWDDAVLWRIATARKASLMAIVSFLTLLSWALGEPKMKDFRCLEKPENFIGVEKHPRPAYERSVAVADNRTLPSFAAL